MSAIACSRHCRWRGRLNPFKGVVMVTLGRGVQRGGPSIRVTDFLGSRREKNGNPCTDKACPVFPSPLPIYFFPSPLFTFRRRDRWSSRHSRNLSSADSEPYTSNDSWKTEASWEDFRQRFWSWKQHFMWEDRDGCNMIWTHVSISIAIMIGE